MQFDFAGQQDAIDGTIVVIEKLLVKAAEKSGLFHDEMRLRVEESFALGAGGRGNFDLQGVLAADLRVADEGKREFVFLWIQEMRIVINGGGFELKAVFSDKRGDIAAGGFMPRGFTVVGIDKVLIADDELGVVAVGELCLEGVRAGFPVGGVGERAFEAQGMDFGQGFASAGSFDVLCGEFRSVLRLQGESAKCEGEEQ